MIEKSMIIIDHIRKNIFVVLLPNQALPEGIPLGQADGVSVGAIYIAGGGFSFLLFSF